MNKAREIAERLNLTIRHVNDNGIVFIPSVDGIGNRKFNPYENWNDCGKVLEKLLEHDLDFKRTISPLNNCVDFNIKCHGGGFVSKDKDLKTAICNAFLSMEGV